MDDPSVDWSFSTASAEMEWPVGSAVSDNGRVRLAHISGTYNPYDHYSADKSTRSPYLDFAALGDASEGEIARFVSEHGPIGIEQRSVEQKRRERALTWVASPDVRSRNAVLAVDALLAISRIGVGYSDGIEDIKKEAHELRRLIGLQRKAAEGDVASSAELARVLNEKLRQKVWPRLTVTTGKLVQTWSAVDLLAAFHHMLFLDAAGSLPIRPCENETCRKLFVPTRRDRVYCSWNCSEQQRARKKRRKKRAAQNDRGTEGQNR